MQTYSSRLQNTILVYAPTESETTELIRVRFEPLVEHLLVFNNHDDLLAMLDPMQYQVLIIMHNETVSEFYDYLQTDTTHFLTQILVVPHASPLTEILHPFHFILFEDDTLLFHLQQILHFQQGQAEAYHVSEQRILELENKLLDAKRVSNEIEILKNAIVRNVSHELKTPLLHVKAAVSLMAEDMGKENKLIRYADNATARLETLVTNITMYGSSLDVNLGPTIVRDAVEYAYRNLGRIWESKEEVKRIQLQIDSDLPPVIADRQGLSTILQLLLDNASKFSKDGIEVHAHHIDDEVEISVKDYGIGIAKKDLTKIFDSFYQLDSTSTRRYGGTGVGLSLVKLLLEYHNSKIHVDSRLGKGSTFAFRLPVVKFD